MSPDPIAALWPDELTPEMAHLYSVLLEIHHYVTALQNEAAPALTEAT